PPPETMKDAPWRPFTIPNLIAAVRLAGIPLFLYWALNSPDGKDIPAAALYCAIGWSDYLDGFIARLTGQYSRLGALLDPVADRSLAVAGMYVSWRFELLPRWAVALVLAREVLMLVIGMWVVRKGVEVRINWAGRLGVGPILAAPFWAMVSVEWFALGLLYTGMVLSFWATVLYIRDSRLQLKEIRKVSTSS
ncbi:MAG: CDP-alcohol phosphatidyltransferase family protein, partial [Acidobacteria bacterium]|nr:CDP-alcohol phosphatidyltransferase family protein [Acidobacteriota bacterium]